jgi:outer membrane protein assembly factor BamB
MIITKSKRLYRRVINSIITYVLLFSFIPDVSGLHKMEDLVTWSKQIENSRGIGVSLDKTSTENGYNANSVVMVNSSELQFNQGFAYDQGLYNTSAAMPTAFNHTRQSKFNSIYNPIEKWSVFTGAGRRIHSPIAIDSDGTLYTGTNYFGSYNHEFYAITPEGSVKWKTPIGYSGMSASPVLASDGTIYVPGSPGSYGGAYVSAFTRDGLLKWKTIIGDSIRSTPAISSDGSLYIGVVLGADQYQGELVALNPDGTFKWRYKTIGSVESSPAIAKDGTIYAGEFGIVALSPEGYLKWRFNPGKYFPTSPVLGGDGTVYIKSTSCCSSKDELFAINPNGTKKWSLELGGADSSQYTAQQSSPAIDKNGVVYVGSKDGYVYAVNPDGTKKWSFKTNGPIESSPIILKDGTIYIGSDDGYLYAINPDGTKKWSYQIGAFVSTPSVGADQTIYVGASDGKIYALEHGIPVEGIKLNYDEITLTEGGTQINLGATILPDNASNKHVNWVSSDPTIATIDSLGNVTPLIPGHTTITATTKDGGYTAICKITVEKEVINVKSINLDQTSVVLAKGEQKKLTAVIEPANATNKNVEWTSSNTSVATIDRTGLINPIAAGTTTLTVTTKDGNFTASATLKVVVPVTGITLKPTSITLIKGKSGKSLVATISPEDASNQQVDWKSSDPSIVTVDHNGYIDPVNIGTATITVTTEDGGFTSDSIVTVVPPFEQGNAYDQGLYNTSADMPTAFNQTRQSRFNSIKIPIERWSVFTGAGRRIHSPIAIDSDGTLYTGTDYFGSNFHEFYAITPEGSVKWKTPIGYSGMSASPVLASDGTIYVPGSPGSYGGAYVSAFTREGILKWKTIIGDSIRSTPAISSDGSLYIGVALGAYQYQGELVALNPDGTFKWRYKTIGSVESSPAIAKDGTIYAGEFGVVALSPEGYLKWRFDPGKYFPTSPVLGEDGTVYIKSTSCCSKEDELFAINPNGTKKWSLKLGGADSSQYTAQQSSPAIDRNGVVYVGSKDGYVYTVNPDGTKKWSFKTNGPIESSPLILKDGTIYIGSDDGYLYAINPDGTKKWSYQIGAYVSTPTVGADQTIYVGASDGKIYALEQGVPVQGINLNYEKVTLTEGDPSLNLVATVTPNNASNKKVIWSSSDLSTVSVDSNGVITPLKPGYVTVSATTIDGDFIDYCEITVSERNTSEIDVAADTAELAIIYSIGDSDTSVTKDITLVVSSARGSTISWASSDTTTISSTGKVTRPGSSTGNKVVTLTATISKGNAVQTKQFVITVKEFPTLTISPFGGTYQGAQTLTITSSDQGKIYYTLDGSTPTTMSALYTSPITITSSKTIKYFFVDAAGNATSIGSQSYIILYNSDVTADKNALQIGFSTGDSAASVTQDITLGVSGENGSTITWTSSNTTTVSTAGVITRPAAGSGDKVVTLTATIRKGSSIQTKQFVVTVKQLTDTIAPTVTINPVGGMYQGAQLVTITSSEPGNIYYTVNGSTPTTFSSVYNGPITISYTKTLKYFAIDSVGNKSAIGTQTYTILYDDDVNADTNVLEIKYAAGESANSVTKNVTLSLSGGNGSTISWASSDTSIVSANGMVTRPTSGSGDKAITLTATISKGGSVQTKQFVITVKQLLDSTPPTVTINLIGGTYQGAQTIVLTASEPSKIYYTLDGSTPTTSSTIYSAPISISASKTLNYFAVDNAGNASTIGTQSYTIRNDAADSTVDANALQIGYASGETENSVTKNITLAVSGANGSTISWSSSASSIVSVNGVVTRPAAGQGDQTVTLTATIQKGTVVQTKVFVVIVKQLPDVTPPSVIVDVVGGTYNSLQTVSITATEPAAIYYTLDGSEPNTSSFVYNSPLEIATTTTLKYFAVDVAGNASTIETQIYTILITATGWVEEYHSSLRYSGNWTVFESGDYSGGAYRYGGGRQNSVELTFEGIGIRWIAATSEKHGLADVYIDGQLVGEVNLYSKELKHQQVVFETSGLSNGVHTIRIVKKNALGHPNGKDTNINVDAFDIVPFNFMETESVVEAEFEKEEPVFAETSPENVENEESLLEESLVERVPNEVIVLKDDILIKT